MMDVWMQWAKTEKLSQTFIQLLSNIGRGILFLMIGMIVLRLGRRAIEKFFQTQKKREKYAMGDRKADTLSTILISVLKYVVYFVIILNVLQLFGAKVESILTVAGVGGVAIGFGAQSLVKDVITGFFILLEDQFGVGDIVTLQTKTGTVEEIGLRTTRIRSFDGDVHIIPNGEIRLVTNMTNGYKRAVIDIGIAYEQNIDQAIAVIQEVCGQAYEEIEGILKTPEVMGVTGLADSSVNIRVFADCMVKENWRIERELRKRIKDKFDQVGINIPFPQRTVHIVQHKNKEE